MKRILVTGANGHTGGYAVDTLLAKGQKNIRALVIRDDSRAEDLKSRGVEVVIGDIREIDDVRAALDNVDTAYFVYPIEEGGVATTAYFAQAAREAGVQAIVNMSQRSARRDAASRAARDHWIAERVFDWSGIPTTHLRPTFFAEWLLYPFQKNGIKQGVLRNGLGQGRHAPIAAEDQGRVIAEILLNPVPHAGEIYPLFGPIEQTGEEIAQSLSRALGQEVAYEGLSPETFSREIEQAYNRPFLAQHLLEVAKDHAAGIFAGTNDVVKRITGREPITVEQFVAKNRAAFDA